MASGKDKSNLWCDICGYLLSGLKECRCPECGEVFDPKKLRILNSYQYVNPIKLAVRLAITPFISCIMAMACILTLDFQVSMYGIYFVLAVGFSVNLIMAFESADELARYHAAPDSNGISEKRSFWRETIAWITIMFLTNAVMVICILVFGFLYYR